VEENWENKCKDDTYSRTINLDDDCDGTDEDSKEPNVRNAA